MYSEHENAQSVPETVFLPLDLTSNAANRFPAAVSLAQSLEADRTSLEPVRDYLMRKQGFTSEEATHALNEYLKFLVLIRTTKEQFAPSEVADIAWHAHILHTQLYEPFCRKHFGKFLHHVPSAPDFHPSDDFLKKQSQLGEFFYGPNNIYRAHHGHCVNSHDCVSSPNHCVGTTGPSN
jgi:hypothetical protein